MAETRCCCSRASGVDTLVIVLGTSARNFWNNERQDGYFREVEVPGEGQL